MLSFNSLSMKDMVGAIVRRVAQNKGGESAYTLIVGSGFSYPIIPTAGQMVRGDRKKPFGDIAAWCFKKKENTTPEWDPTADAKFAEFQQTLWRDLRDKCRGDAALQFDLGENGLPTARDVVTCSPFRTLREPICGQPAAPGALKKSAAAAERFSKRSDLVP